MDFKRAKVCNVRYACVVFDVQYNPYQKHQSERIIFLTYCMSIIEGNTVQLRPCLTKDKHSNAFTQIMSKTILMTEDARKLYGITSTYAFVLENLDKALLSQSNQVSLIFYDWKITLCLRIARQLI